MITREMVTRSVISGSIAAVSFLAISGLIKALTAEVRAVTMSRVAYQNGRYLLAVRDPGEWHTPQDFVQPYDAQVQALYREIGPDAWECYRWVCQNISYARERVEFWRWPGETISEKRGDCEDTSLVLASLLNNFSKSYVVLGEYLGYGHAWVQLNSQILETTLTEPIIINDTENYCAHAYFNEQIAVELWPGALEEVFQLRRNDLAKLRLIGT